MPLKSEIRALLQKSIDSLVQKSQLPIEANIVDISLERPRNPQHGDFACNIALQLAKSAQSNPREIALLIKEEMGASPEVEKIEIAGPGFINLFLTSTSRFLVIPTILAQCKQFGRSQIGKNKRVQVEFVSANPTGPLHVGHGRGAAYGAVVANLLETIGFNVHREYYVNDAGRQMHILTISIWLRYLQRCGITIDFPENGYRGDYVRELAAELYHQKGASLAPSKGAELKTILPGEAEYADKERYIDLLIEHSRQLLGEIPYRFIFDMGLNKILDGIRDDLRRFGIEYDEWFSERSLTDRGLVNRVIEKLREAGHIYEKDGALWFCSTQFGDEKDRVVQRENGQTTYFASDIAYHLDKYERGFDWIIDIWGADHHGYVPRVKAALKALGENTDRLNVLLVQFAILYRGSNRVRMSTRSGSFVTLRELREEVGKDAARFFYISRSSSQHLDFDLELAKSQSSENPVYYIQYAHARISSVFCQLRNRGYQHDINQGNENLEKLTSQYEVDLANKLGRYPEIIEFSALNTEPHLLAQYLREIAQSFHTWYNAEQFITPESGIRNVRLNLCLATQQIIRNGLNLLGVSAPENM